MIDHLNQGEELTPREIAVAADFLLDESGDVAKKAHFLKAMAEKGESAAEIAGFVSVFLEKGRKTFFLWAFVQWPDN